MYLRKSLYISLLLSAGVIVLLAVLSTADYENSGAVTCAESGCHREVAEEEHLVKVHLLPQEFKEEGDRWSVIVVMDEWNDTLSDWEKSPLPLGVKMVKDANGSDRSEGNVMDIKFNNETGVKHLVLTVPEELREEGDYTLFIGAYLDGEAICVTKTFPLPTSPAKPVAEVFLEDNDLRAKEISKYVNQYGRAEVFIDGSGSSDMDLDDQDNLSFRWQVGTKLLSTSATSFHYVFTEPGIYEITLTVTDGQDQSDADTAIVTILDKVYKPDLFIEDFIATPGELYPEEDLTIGLRVGNAGNTAADNFYVKLYDTHQGVRTSFKSIFIGELRENSTRSYTIGFQTKKVGEHFLEIRIDPDNGDGGTVQEFDENNNELSSTFLIKEIPVPNPVITEVWFSETDQKLGQEMSFEITLDNDAAVETLELKVKLYINKVPVETLQVSPYMGEQKLEMSWTIDRTGDLEIQVSLQDTESEVLDHTSHTITVKEEQHSGSTSDGDGVSMELVVGSVTISLAVLGLGLGFASDKYEGAKYALLGTLIPLYTRITKEDTLKHELRDELYQYIVGHPGQNYITIKNELHLKNGTLIYHLKTLETQHFIKSVKDGRYRRFYPWGMKVTKDETHLTEIQRRIIDLLVENPGISQSQIGELLGQSRQTINYQIGKLKSNHIVEVERRGITSKCFVADQWKNN